MTDFTKVRVKRPKQHSGLMDELVKNTGTFDTLKDLLVFAACLGLSKGRKTNPLEAKDSAEPIELQRFSAEYDKMVINTIAIKDSGDPYIMGDEKTQERIAIFEQYAAGGLEIIHNRLASKHMEPDEVLVDLVMNEQGDSNVLNEITALADL